MVCEMTKCGERLVMQCNIIGGKLRPLSVCSVLSGARQVRVTRVAKCRDGRICSITVVEEGVHLDTIRVKDS